MHLPADLKLTTAQISLTGLKSRNEDCLSFFMPVGNLLITKGACALIADGVSTAEAGAEAAEYAVREFINDYFDTPDIWTVKKSAQKVLTAINRTLYGRSHSYSEHRGHICTLSVLVLKSRTAHIFHIGDSRVYLIRRGKLELLTQDHLVPLSASNSCLSRAMGMDTHLDIDYRAVPMEEGDLFLLSTDGIHDFIEGHQLVDTCLHSASLDQACQSLTEQALANGSGDNLSCQLVKVDHLGSESLDDLTQKLTRLPFPPALQPGLKLDGYRVLEQLYASNRSQLYRVEDEHNGQQLVMKTPSPNFDDDPAYIERFIMEEWVGSRIQSPHVVKVVNSNRPKSFLYYLMEQVPGVSLERWMTEHPNPRPSEAIHLVRQIAEGLKAFHQRETLHQDLKPGNIMVGPEQQVKIVDFGSVYVAGIDEIFVPLERDKILGTVHYTDPVLRLGQHSGIKSDLFSLASITYELFTGRLPYGNHLEHCDSPQQLLRLRYVPCYRFNPILPVWFDRTLEKALAPDPEQRYPSLDAFLEDLTYPNPAFVNEREEEQKSSQPVLLWQVLSAVWLISLVFVLLVFWLNSGH